MRRSIVPALVVCAAMLGWLPPAGAQSAASGVAKETGEAWEAVKAYTVEKKTDAVAYGKKIVAAGGSMVVESQEVPGMGSISLFLDPEGRMLGLWKAAK